MLIRDHHAGYISWEEYEHDQNIISGNASMKGAMGAGFGAQRTALYSHDSGPEQLPARAFFI